MNIHTTRNSVFAAIAFAVLSGVSTLGSATLPTIDAELTQVGYTELGLTTNEGHETPYQRLRPADTEACDEELTS